jgi:hypothetical protein
MPTNLGRVVAALGAMAIATVACANAGPATGSPTAAPSGTLQPATSPAATASPGSPSPSPTTSPLALESCGEITHYQDGNVGPVLCPDGRPSLAADTFLRSLLPALAVLRLEPTANLTDVETAMCADKTFGHSTNSLEESAYRLKAAEEGWGFGDEPVAWLTRQAC